MGTGVGAGLGSGEGAGDGTGLGSGLGAGVGTSVGLRLARALAREDGSRVAPRTRCPTPAEKSGPARVPMTADWNSCGCGAAAAPLEAWYALMDAAAEKLTSQA